MQLTIERSALLKALGHVQSVVERRNTIPILSNVLLSAGRDKLSFAATDLDMEMVDEAEATVQVEGQITAPAHTLYEIVRKLPDGAEVALTYNGDDPRLTVQAGRSKFNLPVLPAGDFPVMSTETSGTRFTLMKEDLARLIDKTRFAVSTEETRYYLNGLYLHTVAEAGIPLLRAVATDGHRLALAETPAPEGAAGGPGVIVPRKTIDQVRRLLDDGSGPVEVQVSPAEDPLRVRPGVPDLQGHRRRLPRLHARHPQGERQAGRYRQRRLRLGRRPRRHHLGREEPRR